MDGIAKERLIVSLAYAIANDKNTDPVRLSAARAVVCLLERRTDEQLAIIEHDANQLAYTMRGHP